jgi:hypothetical protein
MFVSEKENKAFSGGFVITLKRLLITRRRALITGTIIALAFILLISLFSSVGTSSEGKMSANPNTR